MTRNLKILGLALAAVFAFNALVASGASAQLGKFTSATGVPFTTTGTEVAGGVNEFTGAFGVKVKCPGSTYTGHKVNTVAGFIANGATEVTIRPTYVNCVDQNGAARTVDMNGCDYVFRDATTAGAAGTYSVVVDVVCPVGKKIVVTGGSCLIEVGPQTGLTGLHLTNEAGDVRVKGSVGLKATVCGFSGLSVTQDQDVTNKAHNEAKAAVNGSVSD